MQVTSRTGRARRILGDFEKVRELRWDLPRGNTVGFRLLAETFVARAKRVVGGRWKSQKRKIVPLLMSKKNFKLKGNKKFCTWTKKSLRVFRISRFLCSMLYIYEHYMSISDIVVSGYGTCVRRWILVKYACTIFIPLSWSTFLMRDNKHSKITGVFANSWSFSDYNPHAFFFLEGYQQMSRGLILFTNPSAWAGYDTRSIFKRSLTGLNSEFSFS